MLKVTLRYMGCIRESFTTEMLFVNSDGRILSFNHDTGHTYTGWTLDGNTSIETEPEVVCPVCRSPTAVTVGPDSFECKPCGTAFIP